VIIATGPTIFKWRQTEPALILCAVRRYLRYSLSLRDVEELLEERGLKPTNKSWRVDELTFG
jgi:IS6 family transposase